LRGPRSALAQARFGEPVLSISASRLSVGDHVELVYQQQWKRVAEVDRIVAQLVLRETVQYTSVSSSDGRSYIDTERHDKVVQRHATPGRRFQAGEVCGDRYAFQIPPDRMHTFAPTLNNRIEWYVTLAVEVPKWPGGLRREFEITVLPLHRGRCFHRQVRAALLRADRRQRPSRASGQVHLASAAAG
jgi:hypothetical protein